MKDQKLLKYYPSEIREIEEDKRTIKGFITTVNPDRVGDIVEPYGVETKNWENTAKSVFFNHETHKPAIGRCLWFQKEDKGIVAKTEFAETPLGLELWYLYKNIYMNSHSIGFRVIDLFKNKDGNIVYSAVEMLEYSLVGIPCNADCVTFALQSKNIKTEEMTSLLLEWKDKYEIKEKVLTFEKRLSELDEINKLAEKVNLFTDKMTAIDETLKKLSDSDSIITDNLNKIEVEIEKQYKRKVDKEKILNNVFSSLLN